MSDAEPMTPSEALDPSGDVAACDKSITSCGRRGNQRVKTDTDYVTMPTSRDSSHLDSRLRS